MDNNPIPDAPESEKENLELALLAAQCARNSVDSLAKNLDIFFQQAQKLLAAYKFIAALSKSADDLANSLREVRSHDPYHKNLITCVIDLLNTLKRLP